MSGQNASDRTDGDAARMSGRARSTGGVAYEIIYQCRDEAVGARLVQHVEGMPDPVLDVEPHREGTTWSLTLAFPSAAAADRYFTGPTHRQFCVDVRRSCRSSVLVVPLGPLDDEPGGT